MTTAGKRLVQSIIDDMAARGLEPDCREQAALGIAEGLADKLEALDQAIAADGVSVTLKSGRPVVHRAIAEARQIALALDKVLQGVAMDEGVPVNRAKHAAAQARWRAHNEAKARRDKASG
jgi:hypothetical protein